MQIGVLSIPLMDHLQNETVRATLLYGMESHFPYQEVALTSTRYWPTLTLAAYRQQTYNGRFYADKNNDRIVSGYYDEKGVRLERELSLYGLGGQIYLGVGLKYANLKPYLGPYNIRRGNLIEPAATLGVTHSLGRVSFSNSIEGRVAPASVNENFDYNQLGGSTSMSLGVPGIAEGKWIKSSKLSLGLEGSRTRGRERRALKEMYTPLKTFVPGAGGGYNKNSFPVLSGEAGGLFSPVFGDSQARAKASWTMPVIADFDKIWGIFYLERLDFTAFYNYGAAWVGDEPRVGWRKLIRAHGYNLDLQLEDKGFRFNVGLGTGQVIGDDFEIYATTGFDALF
jgi:hypothetical protein